MEVSCKALGDKAVRVCFGESVSHVIHQRVRQLCIKLEKLMHPDVVEWVPSYTAVTVFYNPLRLFYHEIEGLLFELVEQLEEDPLPAKRIVHVPTCYSGPFCPDLDVVAAHTKLTKDEVVKLHSQGEYLVFMLGFSPGFPYLGGLDQRLETPRLAAPRASTPAGAVGIAGVQTGIYSIESPGGWQIIGRTPLVLYDPYRAEPTLFKVGDVVKFEPITVAEYEQIRQLVEKGEYELYWKMEEEMNNDAC